MTQRGRCRYVLVTPAKNEAKHIQAVIESVLGQTVRPIQWVIVDDGSTDQTATIVDRFTAENSFITLLRLPPAGRSFASKARAFNYGLRALESCQFDYAGNIDADVRIDPSYYENLAEQFERSPNLGITGGVVWEHLNGRWECVHTNPDWCVGGAAQFFRRECLEQIGGYRELPAGGEDTLAEYLARANGWNVCAIDAAPVWHDRTTMASVRRTSQASYRMGLQDYYYGSSVIYEMSRCVLALLRHPFVVGGAARFMAYLTAILFFRKKHVDLPTARIVASQQRARLLGKLTRLAGIARRSG